MRRNNTDETHKNRFTGLFVVSLTATVQAADFCRLLGEGRAAGIDLELHQRAAETGYLNLGIKH